MHAKVIRKYISAYAKVVFSIVWNNDTMFYWTEPMKSGSVSGSYHV